MKQYAIPALNVPVLYSDTFSSHTGKCGKSRSWSGAKISVSPIRTSFTHLNHYFTNIPTFFPPTTLHRTIFVHPQTILLKSPVSIAGQLGP
jgi:hypothetical protein